MKHLLHIALIWISVWPWWACQPTPNSQDQSPAPSATPLYDDHIELPDGFKAIVVHPGVGPRARHIAVNRNGDIYVQMNRLVRGKGIVALRDTTGDGRADIVAWFGDHTGTGIAIHKGYLYCSSDQAIYRYPLHPDELVPKPHERELVVGGFPEQQEHAAKSFTFDDKGHLYVNVGAPSNACMKSKRTAGSPGIDPCPQLQKHAGIWQFADDRLAQQFAEGTRYASGIRNAIALDWNFDVGKLYVVQHGRDQLYQFWPQLYDEQLSAELPAEEFFQIEVGDFCGWPYCYYDQLEGKKVLAPEYGGDGKKVGRCAQAKQPILAFPGHLAPNDLVFYTAHHFPETYQGGAFIAFHGSWNRAPLPQKGYFIAFVPMKEGLPSGPWRVFADHFAGKDTIKSPSQATHRPMGLAIGPDGALYVSDSVKGTIWKIVYKG